MLRRRRRPRAAPALDLAAGVGAGARGRRSRRAPARPARAPSSRCGRRRCSRACACAGRPLRVLDDEAQDRRAPRARGAGARGRCTATRRARAAAARRRRARLRQGAARACSAALEDELGLAAADASAASTRRSRGAGGTPGGVSSKLDVALDPAQRADGAAAVLLVAPAEADRAEPARARWPTSTPSSCTTCASRCAARARCSASCKARVPAGAARALPRRVPLAAAGHRARRATSTSTCSSSTSFARRCPRRSARDLEPLRALLLERRRARAARGWCARCARARCDGAARRLAALPRRARRRCRATTGPTRRAPIADVAGERIAHVYRQMVKMGAAIDDDSPPEALHDLRKKGKELRYLLEFFARALPGRGRRSRWSGRSRRCRTRSAASRTARSRPAMLRALGDEVASARGRRAGADGDGAARRAPRAPSRPRRAPSSPSASRAFAAKPQRALVREDVRVSTRPRDLQHQGRRRQDVGGGQPRLPRRARRRADAAVGPRPAGREHLPASASSRRSRAAARKLVRGKSDVDALIKGTDHERLDLLPADFSYRHMDLALDATKRPTRRAARACSRRSPTSTTTSSSTARRASRWSPRACSRPPTSCSSR